MTDEKEFLNECMGAAFIEYAVSAAKPVTSQFSKLSASEQQAIEEALDGDGDVADRRAYMDWTP